MKKAIGITLALLLMLLALPGLAETQTLNYNDVFTLTYPADYTYIEGDGDYEEKHHLDAGHIEGPNPTDLAVRIEIQYLAEWADHGMEDFTEDNKTWYLEQIPERFADAQVHTHDWMDTAAQSIPFAFIRYTYEETEILRAEMVVKGWYIKIDANAAADATYMEARALTEADEALFKQIVSSLVITADLDEQFAQRLRAL